MQIRWKIKPLICQNMNLKREGVKEKNKRVSKRLYKSFLKLFKHEAVIYWFNKTSYYSYQEASHEYKELNLIIDIILDLGNKDYGHIFYSIIDYIIWLNSHK